MRGIKNREKHGNRVDFPCFSLYSAVYLPRFPAPLSCRSLVKKGQAGFPYLRCVLHIRHKKYFVVEAPGRGKHIDIPAGELGQVGAVCVHQEEMLPPGFYLLLGDQRPQRSGGSSCGGGNKGVRAFGKEDIVPVFGITGLGTELDDVPVFIRLGGIYLRYLIVD